MAPFNSKRTNGRRRTPKNSAFDSGRKYAPPTQTPNGSDSNPPKSSEIGSSRQRGPTHDESDTWRLNKRDKRTIKHSALLGKIHSGRVQKANLKRRRPTKKLRTDLRDLADALPAVAKPLWSRSSDQGDSELEMVDDGSARAKHRSPKASTQAGSSTIVMKSFRHRPGSMKQRQVAETREVERFRLNLAQISQVNKNEMQPVRSTGPDTADPVNDDKSPGEGGEPRLGSDHSGRWQALRSFISSTLEKDAAFTAS